MIVDCIVPASFVLAPEEAGIPGLPRVLTAESDFVVMRTWQSLN